MLAGLSQKQLGAAMDVSPQHVQKLERGVNRINVEALVIIAKTLNTTEQGLIDTARFKEVKEVAEPVSRLRLDAMRGLSLLSTKKQKFALDLINILIGEAV